MKIEIPEEYQKIAEKNRKRTSKRPLEPGELKALWLNWGIVSKEPYATDMHRSTRTYSRLYNQMEQDSETREINDEYFIEFAEKNK